MKNFVISSLFTFCLCPAILNAQSIPIGFWRTHFSYKYPFELAVGDQHVWYATNTAVFSVKKEDFVVEIFDKTNGLSGTNISAMAWHEGENALLVGYTDGIIDVLKEDVIITLTDFKKANPTGTPTINEISLYGDSAIVAGNFGVAFIDVFNGVIASSVKFNNDTNFAALQALDAEIWNNQLYVSTTNGVFKTNLNFADFKILSHWQKINTLPDSCVYKKLLPLQNKLLIHLDARATNGQLNADTLFAYTPAQTTIFSNFGFSGNNLSTKNDRVFISTIKGVNVYTANGAFIDSIQVPLLNNSQDFEEDDAGNHWAAIDYYGALFNPLQQNVRFVSPAGPNTSYAYSLKINTNGTLLLATGGRSFALYNKFYTTGLYMYLDDEWKDNTPGDLGYGNSHVDFVNVCIDPLDPKHFFVASWGNGLYEYKNLEPVKQYKAPLLDSSTASIAPLPYRVGGMDFDQSGNLWLANSNVPAPLVVLRPDGTSASYLNGVASINSVATDVVVDDFGHIWIGLVGEGLAVLNPENGAYKLLKTTTNQGGLEDLGINTLAEDKEGEIWVGTNDGLAIFSPSAIFNNAEINALKIVLVSEEGLNELLLDNTSITDICVDGANRKWIATYKQGVRLVSPTGNEIIYSFTEANSPLISNDITDISIDPNTGEVYFATPIGLCSFRAKATEAEPNEQFGEVYAFPNPVPSNYEGPIAIKGMAYNANVKITDIAGNLVYETQAFGGQAVWNGTRYNGVRVKSGIYLVFAISQTGEERLITKIMLIN